MASRIVDTSDEFRSVSGTVKAPWEEGVSLPDSNMGLVVTTEAYCATGNETIKDPPTPN